MPENPEKINNKASINKVTIYHQEINEYLSYLKTLLTLQTEFHCYFKHQYLKNKAVANATYQNLKFYFKNSGIVSLL